MTLRAAIPTVQFRRLARLRYGDALPAEQRLSGEVPVYASGGLVGTHDSANTCGPVIVIGRKGSYGSLHWSSAPAFVIDTAYSVDQVAGGGSVRWLYYVLHAANLKSLSQDVGVPGLSRDRVHRMRIPLQDSATQRQVADFLDYECARIDELRGELAYLESTLGHASEKSIAVLERAGVVLPPDLSDGPAWGRLPAGWKAVLLGRAVRQLTNGYVGPTRDLLVPNGVRYIQSTHIKGGRIDFDRRPFYVPESWHEARPRIHLTAGDVLIVQTGKLGEIALVPDDFGPASCHALLIARAEPALTRVPQFVGT